MWHTAGHCVSLVAHIVASAVIYFINPCLNMDFFAHQHNQTVVKATRQALTCHAAACSQCEAAGAQSRPCLLATSCIMHHRYHTHCVSWGWGHTVYVHPAPDNHFTDVVHVESESLIHGQQCCAGFLPVPPSCIKHAGMHQYT